MREAPTRGAPLAPRAALAVALGWMLLAQLGCVLAWQAGWFDRPGALVHWLLLGVLPPAMALWQGEA